jgi:TatD DNase family protein
MELVDTHAHLDDAAFAPDLDAIVARAVAAGVSTMVSVGIDVASSRRVVALAERLPQVTGAVGIHPHDAGSVAPETVHELAEWIGHPRVVALGETGLDHYRDDAPRPAQAALFRAHLALAQETGLPVVIHCREAYPDVLAMLDAFAGVVAVFHAFSGSVEMARACVSRGHYLSFAGPLTFTNARRLVDVARDAPLDRILIETDAPFLSPHPHRGRRNEPAHVRLVAQRLAEVRGASLEAIAEATTANARRVFRLAPVEAPA